MGVCSILALLDGGSITEAELFLFETLLSSSSLSSPELCLILLEDVGFADSICMLFTALKDYLALGPLIIVSSPSCSALASFFFGSM